MIDFNLFPNAIKNRVGNLNYQYDNIGESASDIILFDDMVVKIEKTGSQSNREYEVLKWLNDKLPVPEIIEFERKNGFNFILMSRLKDKMACDSINAENINCVVRALADGLKQLWSVDISQCPFDSRLDIRLETAKYNIQHNLVDIDNFDDDTLGPDGFANVDEIYSFLTENKPTDEDLAFTHGDYCLPNVFVSGDKASGFIDLGKAGVADKWQDIALCVRSIKYNLCDLYNIPFEDYIEIKNNFYSYLNISENKEKLRYYKLLDELF
ncbi:MAG: APH(3') family aminoglycoside O-phosphotransferase [Eubacterium sp.]